MKKNLIALAVASAIAAPVAMADAPVVYGQINVNVNHTNSDAQKSTTSVNSTASRLGIKGSEDLGNGLKAVYKVEFGVNVADAQYFDKKIKDSTTQTALTTRNSYAGLSGGFGTVLLGRHDTPLKMSQASDLFNDGAADLGNKNMTMGITVAEDRADDVLAYVSPTFSGVKIVAAAVSTEDTTDGSGLAEATSAAIMYGSTKKGLYLAAANTSATDTSVTRLSAQYKTGGLIANVMHSDASGDAVTEGTVTHFQAGYKIGKFMPKVKYAMIDPKTTGDDSETSYSVGLNYSLGKKTTAYVYMVDADKTNGGTKSTIAGMLHKF